MGIKKDFERDSKRVIDSLVPSTASQNFLVMKFSKNWKKKKKQSHSLIIIHAKHVVTQWHFCLRFQRHSDADTVSTTCTASQIRSLYNFGPTQYSLSSPNCKIDSNTFFFLIICLRFFLFCFCKWLNSVSLKMAGAR